MVKTFKKYETVYFTATKQGGYIPQQIEVEIDYENRSYTICTEGEESVNFNSDNISQSKLKLQALKVAIKYIEEQFKK